MFQIRRSPDQRKRLYYRVSVPRPIILIFSYEAASCMRMSSHANTLALRATVIITTNEDEDVDGRVASIYSVMGGSSRSDHLLAGVSCLLNVVCGGKRNGTVF